MVGLAGALLLGAATLPQAWELARTRRVAEFHAGFILLNVAGISLLALRSAELREWAFLGINLLTASFWLFVLALKVSARRPPPRPGDPAGLSA